MNYFKNILPLLSLVLFTQGCGNNVTIVKTHPKSGRSTYSSEAPWQSAYNSGLAHFNKKEYSKALEYYTIALKQAGNEEEARAWMYYSMGRCYEGLKDLARAEQNYIMAQNLDPNLSEASDGLARLAKLRADKD